MRPSVKISPLLQLLRPPNLFTVPGDPLCGALLASHGVWSRHILSAIVATLACYCFGLVTNDLADYSEDCRERPTRPLPSGAVPRRVAFRIALFSTSLALIVSARGGYHLGGTVLALLAAILFYNLFAKKHRLIAPLAMGLCRGLSVIAGAAATASPFYPFTYHPQPSYPAAISIALYIAAVTALARAETRNPRIPPLIGSLIGGILFIQAAFCLLAGGSGWIASLVLLALWPLSRLVARYFYAS